jgi:hypothetical protein
MAQDRLYAYAETVNYNVSNTGGTAEPPNLLLYARVVCPINDQCNCETPVAKRLSVYILTVW